MNATVVVSCYKQEKYIEECLLSILNQKVDFDFDILIGDDASPDRTPLILRKLSEKFPNIIKVIFRDENVGAAKNYIDLHKKAEGNIVFHFDGDDVMLPGKLQKQYDIFLENSSVSLVFHRAVYFSDDGKYHEVTGTPSFIKNKKSNKFTMSDLARWGTIAVHSSYAYRRESRITKDLNREFMEWFFAMDSLQSEGFGYYIDEPLVKYRCNQVSNAYTSTKSGRNKAYSLYLYDVKEYFFKIKKLQLDLYSNYLISLMAKIKDGHYPSLEEIFFIFKNIIFLRFSKIIDTVRIRKSVSPKK